MRNSEQYLLLPYSIQVLPEWCTDGSLCYLALHPELPGCMSHGETPAEAIENLREARKLYLQTLLEKGQLIPSPYSEEGFKVVWEVIGVPTADMTAGAEVLRHWPSEFSPLRTLSTAA